MITIVYNCKPQFLDVGTPNSISRMLSVGFIFDFNHVFLSCYLDVPAAVCVKVMFHFHAAYWVRKFVSDS